MKNLKGLVIVLLLGICCKGIICCEYQEDCPLCDVEVGEMDDYVCEECDKNIKVNSIDEALNFVSLYMKNINEKIDYWQLPKQSYERKTGDCEDFSILFMYLIKTQLNIDSKLVMIKNLKTKERHVLVYAKNKYYEIINNFSKDVISTNWETLYYISYEETIWMTYHYHNNVGKYY